MVFKRFLVLFCLILSLPVQAFSLKNFLRLDRIRKEHKVPYQSESLIPGHKRISFAFVSDVNLYPVPLDGQLASDGQLRPPINSIVLYEESQVLLQEALREFIHLKGEAAIDFVLFGGSQVYSAKDYPVFVDIANDLLKFGIPYYAMVGANEARALNYVKPYLKSSYYKLKLQDLVILVLDNLSEDIVPEYLPEEATEQYLWFKKQLAELETEQNPVLIFTHKPFELRTKALINKYPDLNLKLIAHSSLYEYSQYQASKDYGLTIKAEPTIVSNSSIAAYPLSYTMIERDSNGELKIYNKEIDLPGLRKLAKERWN